MPGVETIFSSLWELLAVGLVLVAAEAIYVLLGFGAGLVAVELFTGHASDLPPANRGPALEALSDASKLTAKLRLGLGIGGGLDEHSLADFLPRAPGVAWVSLGRALLARALLLGMERAVRDLSARIA